MKPIPGNSTTNPLYLSKTTKDEDTPSSKEEIPPQTLSEIVELQSEKPDRDTPNIHHLKINREESQESEKSPVAASHPRRSHFGYSSEKKLTGSKQSTATKPKKAIFQLNLNKSQASENMPAEPKSSRLAGSSELFSRLSRRDRHSEKKSPLSPTISPRSKAEFEQFSIEELKAHIATKRLSPGIPQIDNEEHPTTRPRPTEGMGSSDLTSPRSSFLPSSSRLSKGPRVLAMRRQPESQERNRPIDLLLPAEEIQSSNPPDTFKYSEFAKNPSDSFEPTPTETIHSIEIEPPTSESRDDLGQFSHLSTEAFLQKILDTNIGSEASEPDIFSEKIPELNLPTAYPSTSLEELDVPTKVDDTEKSQAESSDPPMELATETNPETIDNDTSRVQPGAATMERNKERMEKTSNIISSQERMRATRSIVSPKATQSIPPLQVAQEIHHLIGSRTSDRSNKVRALHMLLCAAGGHTLFASPLYPEVLTYGKLLVNLPNDQRLHYLDALYGALKQYLSEDQQVKVKARIMRIRECNDSPLNFVSRDNYLQHLRTEFREALDAELEI